MEHLKDTYIKLSTHTVGIACLSTSLAVWIGGALLPDSILYWLTIHSYELVSLGLYLVMTAGLRKLYLQPDEPHIQSWIYAQPDCLYRAVCLSCKTVFTVMAKPTAVYVIWVWALSIALGI